ncbi:MAG: class I SAM-dependent DNA methyltransferase, partial [Deltaproteobacteria bacterium]|nr:class I SAM-dependent DNA methyltransferase [Deltaproteobacteria bacterium]
RLALSGGSGLHTVDPHQFLGIEVNPRAAVIAELVLWIGYLQWHFRTFGATEWPEPVLREFKNIEKRDAVLAWDGEPELVRDPVNGKPVTVWDGKSTRKHPVTGEEVPDESKTRPVYRYKNPRKAEWPAAEFVVGNPPFLGKLHFLSDLGEGYAAALRAAWEETVPGAADLVMYWWAKAAAEVVAGKVRQFGFVTTNSIVQAFNRQVVSNALDEGVGLVLAIPDHPWVEAANGAAVRIAMTVGRPGPVDGTLALVASERADGDVVDVAFRFKRGTINPNLSVGARVSDAQPLRANVGVASMGPMVGSRGFVVDRARREQLLVGAPTELALRIAPLRNGRDLVDRPRQLFVIDVDDMDENGLRTRAPAIYQHLALNVRPERLTNRDPRLAKEWWRFRRSNEVWRSLRRGLEEVIVTVETAKHRIFFAQPQEVVAEHGTITFGLADRFWLAVLSSRMHVVWALAAGGTLEDRPRYNKRVCFDPFPFPACTDAQRERIRALGEQLDQHRKQQQAMHPELTITGMYNVLEKNRAGGALSAKEKLIHEQGLLSTLQRIHDELDAAVADAYGWPRDLSDEQLLERLVALNRERAEEEKRGIVRWLRPEYQVPLFGEDATATASKAGAGDEEPEEVEDAGGDEAKAAKGKGKPKEKAPKKAPWPSALPERVAVVEDALRSLGRAVTSADVAACFQRVKPEDVQDILATLVAFRRAEQPDLGCFVAM